MADRRMGEGWKDEERRLAGAGVEAGMRRGKAGNMNSEGWQEEVCKLAGGGVKVGKWMGEGGKEAEGRLAGGGVKAGRRSMRRRDRGVGGAGIGGAARY